MRESNQDVIVVEPELGLYAVLDGMGGQAAGDVAARLAADTLLAGVREKTRTQRRSAYQAHRALRFALQTAAAEVFCTGEARPGCRGMGTTVVACLAVSRRRVVIAHAGDSRAYLLHGGQLITLTRDHTVAQRMQNEGHRSISRQDRHTLTRCLGMYYSVLLDLVEQPLMPGDRLLLCSDGLYGSTSVRAIQRILGSNESPDRIASNLVKLALRGRAADNISAVVISVDGVRDAATRYSSRAGVRRPRTAKGRSMHR